MAAVANARRSSTREKSASPSKSPLALAPDETALGLLRKALEDAGWTARKDPKDKMNKIWIKEGKEYSEDDGKNLIESWRCCIVYSRCASDGHIVCEGWGMWQKSSM